MLRHSRELDNPAIVDTLCRHFGISIRALYSMSPALLSRVNDGAEFAKELRKTQAHRFSMKSVVKGVERLRNKQIAEAMQHFNKALEIDPENVEGLVGRGALYANCASYDLAIGDFEQALRIDPNHANARLYLIETLITQAKTLEKDRKWQTARMCYEKVLRLRPDNEHALKRLKKTNPTKMVGKRKMDSDEEVVEISSSDEERQVTKAKKRKSGGSTNDRSLSGHSTLDGSDFGDAALADKLKRYHNYYSRAMQRKGKKSSSSSASASSSSSEGNNRSGTCSTTSDSDENSSSSESSSSESATSSSSGKRGQNENSEVESGDEEEKLEDVTGRQLVAKSIETESAIGNEKNADESETGGANGSEKTTDTRKTEKRKGDDDSRRKEMVKSGKEEWKRVKPMEELEKSRRIEGTSNEERTGEKRENKGSWEKVRAEMMKEPAREERKRENRRREDRPKDRMQSRHRKSEERRKEKPSGATFSIRKNDGPDDPRYRRKSPGLYRRTHVERKSNFVHPEGKVDSKSDFKKSQNRNEAPSAANGKVRAPAVEDVKLMKQLTDMEKFIAGLKAKKQNEDKA